MDAPSTDHGRAPAVEAGSHDARQVPLPLVGPFRFGQVVVEADPDGPGSLVTLGYGAIDADGEVVRFHERLLVPVALPDTVEVTAALRVLHLVAGVSYYKCLVPAPLAVPNLSAAERAVVEALYDEGLRELAYRNDLPVPVPVDLVDGGPDAGTVHHRDDRLIPAPVRPRRGSLVPVGGGKDSALVAALIPDGHLLTVNPVGAHEHLAQALERPLMRVTRTLDPQLKGLVARGVTNGHVPVTAITSAIAVLVATASGLADVLMGIERSADEPTVVTADGVEVNHQFSKSAPAEALLRAAFGPTGVRYLSLLRPLTELAIGVAVARRGLADDIVSCNRAFTIWNETTASREQRPCGTCAKCLFTALMVAPASTPDEVARRFGRPLLDEADHVEATRELWSAEKPFDCVGERLETAAAVVLLAAQAAWADQVVVRSLAPEARAMLDAAGVDAADLLTVGDLAGLPSEYQPLLAGLAPDLASVAHPDAPR